MKRTSFILLFLFFVCSVSSQSGWQKLPINLTQSVCDVQFLTHNIGYVVVGRNYSPGALWKTANGGFFWDRVFLTSAYLKALHFNDISTGMIVGHKKNLRRTFTGGASWITYSIEHDARTLNGVHFINPSTGWIVGDDNLIMQTFDFGSTWINKWTGSNDVIWNDVFFSTAKTGIVVGSSLTRSTIIKTTNAGEVWSEKLNPRGNWLRLSFSGDVGYIAGNGESGGLIKTVDFGETWNYSSGINPVNDVYCIDNNNAFAVGNNGLVIRTTNSGLSWISQETNISVNLWGIYFLDLNTGWVCGDDGIVLKTTNGGNPIGIKQLRNEVPSGFYLHQNYPNPFNPVTSFRFQVAASRKVIINVFNVPGRLVAELFNEQLSPGTYELDFNGSDLPSGIYLYRMQAGDFSETKKMVLVK